MSKNRIMEFLTFAKLNFAKKGYHNSHRGKTKNHLAKNIMAKMKWKKKLIEKITCAQKMKTYSRKERFRAESVNTQSLMRMPLNRPTNWFESPVYWMAGRHRTELPPLL